jgi:hypothetical protein
MPGRATDELKQRAGKAIVAHAFFRLESALTIALTILLAFFLPRPLAWWRWWFWIVLGAICEVLIVYTSITDERTAEHVVADMLRDRYDPNGVKSKPYREKVAQALEYHEQIKTLVLSMPAGVLRDHLNDSTTDIAEWVGSIFAIAQRLDVYDRDELLQRDTRQVPASIEALRRDFSSATNATVRQQIEETLKAKQAQQDNLVALRTRMEQARFRLEQTLTALGTVYSQFQLIRAQKLSGAEAKSLSEGIRDQVKGLQDILTSMNEVYGQP